MIMSDPGDRWLSRLSLAERVALMRAEEQARDARRATRRDKGGQVCPQCQKRLLRASNRSGVCWSCNR